MGALAEGHMDRWRDATDRPMSAGEALEETEDLISDLESYRDGLRDDVEAGDDGG